MTDLVPPAAAKVSFFSYSITEYGFGGGITGVVSTTINLFAIESSWLSTVLPEL